MRIGGKAWAALFVLWALTAVLRQWTLLLVWVGATVILVAVKAARKRS